MARKVITPQYHWNDGGSDGIQYRIDWEVVAEAIKKDSPGIEFELETARTCVWNAAARWLIEDMNNTRLVGEEIACSIILTGETEPLYHGFIDLEAEITSTALAKYRGLLGKRVRFDWKTTKAQTFSTDWRQDLVQSLQWRSYMSADGPEGGLFSYRGISRFGAFTEINLRAYEACRSEVVNDYLGTRAEIAALRNDFQVWPMNRPRGCTQYQRLCLYDTDCKNMTMPLAISAKKTLSYSGRNMFRNCPEQYRRNSLSTAARIENENTSFGLMVHRGLANVYEQARKIQEGS